ncbi:chondroitin sulfate proteoglycan 4-like [Argiope bruennichi]|uniref:chondroitin sulfate proteoglycan 4-like n=1 Tax=Argiope bruennichi TaxID=94029 RepID=UPI002495329C|nr:chondroitin sulfate proteoglycan 4-like [Argiope bruennichi]
MMVRSVDFRTLLWTLQILVLFLPPFQGPFAVESASFFGASYLKVPLQDAQSKTDIYLRFRTHRANAFLFLAAGSSDYCLVVLENGEIQVRINLGAGEAVLSSTPGLSLNDLLWHELELHRTDADLTLVIDSIHDTYLDIPGRFFELNVKYGVFIGGVGGFSELFLGNIPNFRGCIDDVLFNGHDILKMAAASSLTDEHNVFSVTWNCSDEFDALSNQPISFVEKGSFLALPSWNARNGGSISLDVKTQTSTAVLFYNAGVPLKPDFIALEILDGKTAVSVNEGNGAVVVQSDVEISDGIWHHIDVQFSQSYIEIVVDGHAKNLRPGLGDNRFFDLAGLFYVGGIELNKQARALQDGLQSILIEGAESSLKGCIKNIKINNQLLGFGEAEVTQGIQPDCTWEYMCLQEPCIPGAECYQDGVDSFRCICELDNCVRANFSSGYKLYTKSSKPIDLEILNLQPLVISEGGSDLITANHIKVILDYQQHGIRETGVLFHIVEEPKHGSLEIEIWRRTADSVFSLQDLNTDKVRYSHDGSETKTDSVVFELEFRPSTYRLPPFLEEKHRFVFHIQVLPVNDPPKLKLLAGKIFRIAKYTKKAITKDLLDTEDPDSQPKDIVYTILNLGSPENEASFENAKIPGKSTDTFTQADINDNLIAYNNRGAGNVRVTVRVSDGILSDQSTATFRIVPFDLEVTLLNNTGITLSYDSYALITSENLTFVDNAPDQNLEIRFDVVKQPTYGSLQRLRNNNRWYPVNHFTQRQLKKEKLRYVHNSGRPTYDDFKFTVSSGDIKFPTVYDFMVTYIAINLKQVCYSDLQLHRKVEGIISDTELKYETFPVATPSDHIIYTLKSLPVYGNVILFHSADSETRHKKLEIGSTFTQMDIDSKRLKYKLHRKSYSSVEDVFHFTVSTLSGINSKELEFKIKHEPGDIEAIIINEKVTVLEGGTSKIGPSELHIEIPSKAEIIYNITSPPKHGILRRLSADHNEVEEDFVSLVTSNEILQNRFVYVHSDSENERDMFHFIAYAAESDSDSFVYYGTVHIHVIMKNDNPPVREIDKIFHVVLDGERKLTGSDLKYVDPDIDSTPGDIQYTRREIPNGALFHIDDMSTQVYQFTQVDLDTGKIKFRHSGPPYGKAVLRITDGKFYATGILEIQASKPYINITRNTGLVVKRGENSVISASNLTVETNLDANSDDITYKITSSPKFGEILLNGKSVHEFTQKDLLLENVEYENHNSVSFQDAFSFSAFLDAITVEGRFEFRIYPDIYWEPLKVITNKTLHVDEEKIATIDASVLNITQTNINTNNITYTVHLPPKFGFLVMGDVSDYEDWKSVSKTSPAKIFTQSTINDKKLHYFHTEQNVSEDYFIFDVTNGITSLKDLTFHFKIISKIIFLKTSNITVVEGSEVPIKSNDISVTNPYYEDWITEYLVVEKPKHGYISYIKNTRSKILRFSASHLRSGFIHYVHDGSETTRDWFTVVANATALNKESAPSTVHVLVEPMNDEAPHIVNNTGLDVWEGDVTIITNKHLAAADEDSDPSDITFVISSPSNGYVTLKNDTKTPILSFTQDQIDRGMIAFVHTGEKAGGFKLQINDGTNYDSPHVFTITARVLRIILATNEKLSILPRMQQSITKDHLFVTTNDHDFTRVIDFTVTRGPELGRLLVENPDGSLSPVSGFTQEQVNRNLVLYEHTKPMVGLKASDIIKFDIETQNAETLRDVEFHIEISVGNFASGNLDQLVVLHTLEVKEGGMAVIGQEHVDMSRLFSLWQGKGKSEFAKKLKIIIHSPPTNGWIETDSGNSSYVSKLSFNREDIKKKRVRYYHDDSDTFRDSFNVGFYLLDDKGYPDILLFNGTVNIIVHPVNDHPFTLQTQTASIQIVQGQSLTLGPHILNVTDADDVPKDVVYEILQSPSTGKLIMKNTSINTFTQEDINNNLVQYVHDGSSENRSAFNFKVSDGKHKPAYGVLDITIVPIKLHLKNLSAIEVQQGSTAAFLSSKNLGAETNANNEEIWYNVTSLPSYGHIFVSDNVLRQKDVFRQIDIDNGLVFYMQSDLTASEDYFVVSIKSGRNVLKYQIVNITVIPLVKQNILIVNSSGITFITADVLNASKLAQQTKSNPKFSVLKFPKLGVLKKINKFSKRSFPKSFEFTHEDLLNKRVAYEGKSMDIKGNTVDSFEYILTAPRVQPAKGKFIFTVQPSEVDLSTSVSTEFVTVALKPQPPPVKPDITRAVTSVPETENGEFQQPSLSNDHLLIAGIVLGIVIVCLVIIIVVKCRSIRNERNKKRTNESYFGQRHGKNKTVAGSHTAQSDLDLSDHNHSNGSISLSDDIPPPPPPPTSPSGSAGHLGCIGGNGTSKNRTLKKRGRCLDAEPSLPPPPYILENGEWTEINVPLPTCKVTPIPHGDEINETALKGPYLLRDPSESEDWSNYEGSELRFGPACNPVLRKNQYWV